MSLFHRRLVVYFIPPWIALCHQSAVRILNVDLMPGLFDEEEQRRKNWKMTRHRCWSIQLIGVRDFLILIAELLELLTFSTAEYRWIQSIE